MGAELPFAPSWGMDLGQVSGLTGIPVCATPAELSAWGNVQRPQGRGGSATLPPGHFHQCWELLLRVFTFVSAA